MLRYNKKLILTWGLLVISFALMFHDVIRRLVHDWITDDNYSHGFLIVPISIYFVLERKKKLLETERRPSNWGIVLILFGLVSLVGGIIGSEFFLSRISILGVIAGTVLFLLGWNHLKILLFPICFLLLMIPIPNIIFNQIAFPLQLIASRFGELVLQIMQIPVLREGNVIHLANTKLEVAEACSGIRSLISLFTLGIVYGYFADSRTGVRIILVCAIIPVAIIANGVRVAGTGVAAHIYGVGAAEGFFHTFSGMMVFVVAFAMLFVIHRIIRLVFWRKTPAFQTSSNQPLSK